MRLELSLVEVFCCVYEEGSFSRAAQKLRCSQPTVSGHIKNLEGYIGARLFDRLPKKIVATRAGQVLYKHGRAIMNQKEAAIQELKKLLNRIEGSLNICCSSIPGEYLLPQIVASFHGRIPAVRVEMRIVDSKEACEEVLAGKAEIGFIGTRLDAVGLELRHFAEDELALVVPNNQEWRQVKMIKLEALRSKPFLAREQGSGTRLAFERKIGGSIDDFNVVGCFGSSSAIREGLRAGLGVSVLSTLSVRSEIGIGSLKTVEIEGVTPIKREFYIAVNRNLTLAPIAEAFLDLALESMAERTRFASI
ncbi:MAG TPA: selenium metabolism-associated LysR family transcriptional regulator [Blastocatellia bacterium]|nr:selenium metabolism-associated LysR family transcriptional regulator [Blastocatellia bacterium]